MKTRVNGEEISFDAEPGTMAAEVIRRRAGRTGTKVVCGAGVCGACTIHLDGECVVSCILPAHALEGAEVRTVEGLEEAGRLHPVQRAFIAADGLQCGFCTPGFLMSAAAFYERWRSSGRTGEPEREEIAQALSGHLCRCGAYPGIFEAVRLACSGAFDDGSPDLEGPRVEAYDKVTGRARYTFDVHLPGQLHGRIVRSSRAHAVVESMDLAAAGRVEGVEAVIRLLPDDDEHVRYVGQPVAAVAAHSRKAAREAEGRLDIRYRSLPAVFRMEEALEGEEVAYEKDRPRAPNSSEGPVPPGSWDGNVRTMRGMSLLSVRPGKVRRLLGRADADEALERVSGCFTTSDQIHTALEPHCAVARWPSAQRLEVWASTQTVELLRTELADRFDLRPEDIQVVAEHIGGGFGAKQGLQEVTTAAVLLSRASGGAPVRVVNDRRDEMAVGGYRPGTRVEIDLVADREGRARALRIDAIGSGGVAVNSTISVLSRLFYTGFPKLLRDRDVVTNLPPGKPFRGPYGPPFFLAMESAVDEMAYRLGRDPLDLRRGWDAHEQRRALYDWASHLEVWRSRGSVGSSSGRFRRGVGVAMGGWVTTFYAGTEVEVSISAEGILARTTTQDMGTGSRSVLAQAVAEELGVSRGRVEVLIGRTSDVPGPASSASRTTNAIYVAGRSAARAARSELFASARRRMDLVQPSESPEGLRDGGEVLPWCDVARRVGAVTARGRRGANGPFDILGRIPSGSMAINFVPTTTGAVYVCEVLVDTRLGRIVPQRFMTGIAAGRIVAPTLARHQVQGAVLQGIGYTLFEERSVDPLTGSVLSLGLEEYRIPGIADTPEIDVHFHEEGFEALKGRVAGLSELATVPVAAALVNAVFHATGHRFSDLPLRPGRILEALS